MLASTLRIVVVLVLLTACGRGQGSLVDRLQAGLSEEEAIGRLQVSSGAVHIVYQTSLPKGDPRPPYSEKEIAVAANCLGQLSEIRLAFFRNQLTRVTCYPQNPDSAIEALVKNGSLHKPMREFDLTHGDRRIEAGAANGERWNVTFTSVSLSREQQAWVSKYS